MVTPALVWPGFDAASSKRAKAASRRLARAARCEIPGRDGLALAAAALGIEPPPAGALARLADGLDAGDRSWFCAEPVTLIPDRDTLVLMPLTAAPLTREEADALIAGATAHFGAALVLERGASGRWYAAVEGVSRATGAPPAEVAGQALDVVSLAAGPDAARLRAFLTELQMLWYEHPVNLARREAGRPEANALWLWGGGRLPAESPAVGPVELRADGPGLKGLAAWLGLECSPPAEPGAEHADAIVVIDPESAALGEAWLQAFAVARGEFRIYADRTEWRIPARRGLFHLRG